VRVPAVNGRRRRGPAVVAQPVASGTAELLPDADRPAGWTLRVDGAPQSYVDLADPTYLRFAYMRRLAWIIDTTGDSRRPLRVLHLGGGALTLARYVAVTRPGSTQRVVEHDAALTELVRRVLPLPRRAAVRVRAADARAALEATGDARFDVVLTDVYHRARMPRSTASVEFAAQAARVLRPGGRYAVNIADVPPLAFSRSQAATLCRAFGDVCAIVEPAMLAGRCSGNVVLAASHQPAGLPVSELAASAASDAQQARVLHGADLDRFIAGARPATDATAQDSPEPPPGIFG